MVKSTDSQVAKEFKLFAAAVNGDEKFLPSQIIKCHKLMQAHGYKTIEPLAKMGAYKNITEFFNENGTFDCELHDVIDLTAMYKQQKTKIVFAACVSVFEIGNYLIGLVTNIKAHPDHQRKGMGRSFFSSFSAVIKGLLKNGHTNAFIVVQQSKKLNVHEFYNKLGFVKPPSFFDSWMVKGSDLAVLKITEDEDDECSEKELIQEQGGLIQESEVMEISAFDDEGLVAAVGSGKELIQKQEPLVKRKASRDSDLSAISHNSSVAILTAAAKSLLQEEVKDDNVSVSGSYVSVKTTKTKGGAFNKHCMLGPCNGKFVLGGDHARHLRTDIHKDHDGTAPGAYINCVGYGCDACTKGKYSSAFWTSAFWTSAFWTSAFWTSAFWTSAFWTSAFWTSAFWTSAFWTSAFWTSAFWTSAFWTSAFWTSAFWTSAFWTSAFWTSAFWTSAFWTSFISLSQLLYRATSEDQCFPTDSKIVCTTCTNGGKAKTVINQSSSLSAIGSILNASNISKLPSRNEVGPDDSITQLGKRPSSQTEEVLAQQDAPEFEMPTTKRQKTSISYDGGEDQVMGETLDQTPIEVINTSSVLDIQSNQTQYINVGHDDIHVIEELCSIEASTESDTILAPIVQRYCMLFTQDAVANYIADKTVHLRLVDCLVKLLKRVDQLDGRQTVGLVFAAFIVGQAAWTGAVRMLNQMSKETRDALLISLSRFLLKHYNNDVVDWVCEFWNVIQHQQISLMRYLRSHPTNVNVGILTMSLTVSIQSEQRFVAYADPFIDATLTAAALIVETITSTPKQQLMTFEQFASLTDIIQEKDLATTIESLDETLAVTQLINWEELIKTTHTTSAISNAKSVQSSLDELIKRYGPIDPLLMLDLKQTEGNMFEMVAGAVARPANHKQFALAQYSVGNFKNHKRQMWVVASGEGKSRIIINELCIIFECKAFDKVYLVYDNEYLCNRDKLDFEDYLILHSIPDEFVQFCIAGQEIKPIAGELVMVDESDANILRDPQRFMNLVAEVACVCFTATPDDGKDNGAEVNVNNALTFQVNHYDLGDAKPEIKFDFNATIEAATDTAKAVAIQAQSITGPVFVFGSTSLYEELVILGCSLIKVDKDINSDIIRELQVRESVSKQYYVVFADTQFGTRGIDYRSKVELTLFVAKSFQNLREARQGWARVGRQNDPCRRIIFKDVPLINKREELLFNAKLIGFYSKMVKSPVELKTVVVKKVEVLAPKKAVAKTKRQTALLAGQSKLKF